MKSDAFQQEEPIEHHVFEGTIICKNVFPELDGALTDVDGSWMKLVAFAMRHFQKTPVKVTASKDQLRFYF